MKRIRIIALTLILCISLALFVTGVWAITSTVLFNLNGNIKYYPEGVYVELSGQVYRGDSETTLEPITSNSRYTLEKQTNFDDSTGEPSGNFPMNTWEIGSLPFAPQLKFIKVEVSVTNYSKFAIQGTPNLTLDESNLNVTENLTSLSNIEPNKTVKYELFLEFIGSTETNKLMQLSFNFTKVTVPDSSTFTTLLFSNVGDGVVSVKANPSNKPQGILNIPSKVSINGQDYLVKNIEENAFSGCDLVTNIFIPEGVTSIGMNAFYGCTNLSNILIPNTIIKIDGNAFSGCDSLNYNIYENGKYLGNNDNKYLVLIGVAIEITTININNNCKVIYSVTDGEDLPIETISIPSSVTCISVYGISGLMSLKLVQFAEDSNFKYSGFQWIYNSGSQDGLTIDMSNVDISILSLGPAFFSYSGTIKVTSEQIDLAKENFLLFDSSHGDEIYLTDGVKTYTWDGSSWIE